jgi:acyl-CoA synthetase (AMP-forming)/AMP-acid ligase II
MGGKAKLAGYKRPRSVVFVDELPRNQLGKVLYKELRNRFEPE